MMKDKRIATYLVFIVGCMWIPLFSSCASFHKSEEKPTLIQPKDAAKFIGSIRPYRGDPESHYLLGCYLQERNKHKMAVEEFAAAVEIEPKHAKAYNGMGVSYAFLGEYTKAIDAYNAALMAEPKLDYVYNNLGYAYLLNGEIDSAIKNFKQSVILNTGKTLYHNNLGLAYAMSGKYNLALDQFRKAVGESRAHASLAKVIGRNGLYDKAAKPFAPAPLLKQPDGANNAGEAEKILAKIFSHKETAVPESQHQEAAQSAAAPLIDPFDMGYGGGEAEKILAKIFSRRSPLSAPNEEMAVPEAQHEDSSQFAAALTINPSNGANDDLKKAETVVGIFSVSEPVSTPKEEMVPESQYGYFDTRSAPVTKIEVSNGNGVNGMARRVGDYLKTKGFLSVRLTNARNFNHRDTCIYYSSGCRDQANKLALYLPVSHRIKMVSLPPKQNTVIRLVIGKDLAPYSSLFRNS